MPSGHIDVTKRFDGIERVIGKRLPGQVFGEIPIIFGIAREPYLLETSVAGIFARAAAQPRNGA